MNKMSIWSNSDRIFKKIANIKKVMSEEVPFLLGLPAAIWQILFCLIPFIFVFSMGFLDNTGAFYTLTLDHYRQAFQPEYLRCIYNSIWLTITSVIGCLCFCIPLAYIFVFKLTRWGEYLLAAIMLPSCTNFIIRIYSWFFLLDKNGVFFVILKKMHLITSDQQLLFNSAIVFLGVIYCYFPFMLIPVYIAMNSIPKELIEASTDLGATSWHTFTRIILPICANEIKVGMLSVGLCAFGEFAIPELLGGAKKMFWATVVSQQFTLLRDFFVGSAYTFIGMGFFVVIVLASLLLTKCWPKW